MSGVCMRCNAFVEDLQPGDLRLCFRCKKQPDCGEFQHAYRGFDGIAPGQWICLQCGGKLLSEALKIPAPPPAAPVDNYC